MKTIIVVYTDTKVVDKAKLGQLKKYSFNTDSDVEVGDMLDSNTYDTKMQVVKVLGFSCRYYNAATGELSDEYTSTRQWEIRTLVIRESQEDIIYASIVRE